MSSLRMNQVPLLRGLRGLGDDAEGAANAAMSVESMPDWEVREEPGAYERAAEEVIADSGSETSERTRTYASRGPARGVGSSGARSTVDQVRAQNEPIQQTVDRSQTTIYNPGIAARAQRVSPLAASWRFPISMPGSAGYGGRSRLGTKVALGVFALLGAGALYYALKD